MEANRVKGNEGWAKRKWWIVVLILLLFIAPAYPERILHDGFV